MYDFTQPRIKFLYPQGIEVSLAAEEGLSLMAFHGQVNEPFSGLETGTLAGDVTRPEDGYFTYRNRNLKLKAGDKLYFWLHVIYKDIGYNLRDQVYTYQGSEVANHNPEKMPVPQNGIQPVNSRDSSSSDCIPSVTVIPGQRTVCSGAEVFSDNFDKQLLDTETWSIERRFGDAPDFEFVLYSTRSLSLSNGTFRITPVLLSDAYRDPIRTKEFHVDDCTGTLGTPECEYDRNRITDIVAPIVSARISTVNSFSFQYGRIEIRAKLPRADWVFPQLFLEPKGNRYRKDELRAGQVRIAFIANYPNVHNVSIKQGVLLGAKEPLRSAYLRKILKSDFDADWDKQFHTFAVDWRPDGFRTYIDGSAYSVPSWRESAADIPGSGTWSRSKTRVAPFDQDFFITLGVGVGGINDFQGYLPWDNTSPQLKRIFYQDKAKWIDSWTPEKKTLEVDYVKVFAL